jgi:hypothetical protein
VALSRRGDAAMSALPRGHVMQDALRPNRNIIADTSFQAKDLVASMSNTQPGRSSRSGLPYGLLPGRTTALGVVQWAHGAEIRGATSPGQPSTNRANPFRLGWDSGIMIASNQRIARLSTGVSIRA